MHKYSLLIIFIVLSLSFSSCIRNQAGKESVVFDCAESIIVDLGRYSPAFLDSQDGVGAFEHVCFMNNRVYIHSSQSLQSFDSETGKDPVSYSRRGRAANEYSSLWGFNVGNGSVFLHDLSGNKILKYFPDGSLEHIFNYSTETPRFQSFAILMDGTVVGKRSFQGVPTQEISVWSPEFNYEGDVHSDSKTKSGLMLSYPFSYSEDGDVLFVRYFRNEVYTVGKDSLTLRYRIDFGDRNLPVLGDDKDEYDALDLFRESNGKASYISNFSEDRKYIAFQFLMSPEGVAYAVHKKGSDSSRVFRFSTDDEIVSINTYGGYCYVFTQNIKGDTMFYRLGLSDLMNYDNDR